MLGNDGSAGEHGRILESLRLPAAWQFIRADGASRIGLIQVSVPNEMTPPFWKSRKFWGRVGSVLGVILLFILATHPELRILVSFLDAIGFDTLFLLLSAQAISFLSSTVKPVLLKAWHRLTPLLKATDRITTSGGLPGVTRTLVGRTLGEYGGYLGQYVWVVWSRFWRTACLGPYHSLETPEPGQLS